MKHRMRKRNTILWTFVWGMFATALFFVVQGFDYGVVTHEILISSPSPHAVATAVSGVPVHVVRVIDGDTIELGNGERLRYIGIDTPEEIDPRKPVQCFAKEASERNKELVENKDIIFYKDILDRDRYGRLLGFVYLPDGTFINKTLVSQGYAFAYPYKSDISKAKEFQHAQNFAREHDLGLWAACSVSRVLGGREQTNAVH